MKKVGSYIILFFLLAMISGCSENQDSDTVTVEMIPSVVSTQNCELYNGKYGILTITQIKNSNITFSFKSTYTEDIQLYAEYITVDGVQSEPEIYGETFSPGMSHEFTGNVNMPDITAKEISGQFTVCDIDGYNIGLLNFENVSLVSDSEDTAVDNQLKAFCKVDDFKAKFKRIESVDKEKLDQFETVKISKQDYKIDEAYIVENTIENPEIESCTATYCFTESELVAIYFNYTFTKEFNGSADDKYNIIIDLLTKEYGEPNNTVVIDGIDTAEWSDVNGFKITME